MKKIFQSAVALSTRGYKLKSAIHSIQKSHKLMLATSFVFVGQFAFRTVSLNDYYEVDVVADLKDGESREIQVGPQKDDCVLLCKVDGNYYCVSNKCSHFGGPLSQGPLFGDKVKCPWHNASFSVKDGSMDEGPMLNGIQTFPVEVHGDKIKLKIKKDLLNKSRTLNMVTRGDDPNHYVIIGGGPAGLSAAESLRQGGFRGRITILTAEEYLPYDRTGMSKALLNVGPHGAQLRNQEFLDQFGIEVRTQAQVEGIEYDHNSVKLRGGEKVHYNKLLIATGGSARKVQVPGIDLQNIFTLRNVNDAKQLKEPTRNAKNIVIVGTSFIGLEAAASIKNELKDMVQITVIGESTVPFERSLGPQIGQALQSVHEKNGIKFINGSKLVGFRGHQNVEKVVLNDGTVLDADVVLLGTGIQPNVGFVGDLKLSKTNGGVETDAFLRTSQQNVYAAGDVASFPYWYTGENVRIEHHNEAIYQGFVAAMNMLGNPTTLTQVPFFWTRHFDKGLQFSGVNIGYDEVIFDGDLNEFKFVAYYAKNGKVVASASINVPQAQQVISEALRLNIMPTPEDLKDKKANLQTIRESVKSRAKSCQCKRADTCKTSL